jgi:hypothetical protein
MNNYQYQIRNRIDDMNLIVFEQRQLFIDGGFDTFMRGNVSEFLDIEEETLIFFLSTHKGSLLGLPFNEIIKDYAIWPKILGSDITIEDAKFHLWFFYKSMKQYPTETEWEIVASNSDNLKDYLEEIISTLMASFDYVKRIELGLVNLFATENYHSAGKKIFQFIMNAISENGSYETIEILEKAIIDNPVILFYPSSGLDIDDIERLTYENLFPYTSVIPNIFIHTDADLYAPHITYNNTVGSYQILSSSIFNIEVDGRRIEIYHLISPLDKREIWLIQFARFKNEELLKFFLESRTPLTFLYSFIDGITSGMGGIEESLSTAYYAYFYELLSVKHVITEYSKDFVRRFCDQYRAQQHEVMNNFLEGLDDSEIVEKIRSGINNRNIVEQTEQYREIYPNNDLTIKTHISYDACVTLRYCGENAVM